MKTEPTQELTKEQQQARLKMCEKILEDLKELKSSIPVSKNAMLRVMQSYIVGYAAAKGDPVDPVLNYTILRSRSADDIIESFEPINNLYLVSSFANLILCIIPKLSDFFIGEFIASPPNISNGLPSIKPTMIING